MITNYHYTIISTSIHHPHIISTTAHGTVLSKYSYRNKCWKKNYWKEISGSTTEPNEQRVYSAMKIQLIPCPGLERDTNNYSSFQWEVLKDKLLHRISWQQFRDTSLVLIICWCLGLEIRHHYQSSSSSHYWPYFDFSRRSSPLIHHLHVMGLSLSFFLLPSSEMCS